MSNIIDKIQLSGVTYDIGGSDGITSGEVQTMIDESISGKTNQSDFTAHTSNTSIHVTTAQTAAWDAKSNFSGSYNDLTDKPTIPTVPTSNTAFTNDAGYITDSALEDYATESYVTNGLDGKQDTLESGVNIKTVNNYSLLGSGNINIGGSGGNNVVELTQAEYDALDPKDPSAFYIITDAEGGDLANYMTSAQTTSAIAQAVSGKTDNSDFTGHTADTTVHVTSTEKAAWNAKSDFSGSYNDLTNKLSAGTGISIVDNVISATGGGGGITSGEVQTMIDESISGKTNQNDNLFTIRTNVIETVVIAGGSRYRIIFAFDIIQNNQIVLSTDTVNGKSSLLSELATLGFDNKIYDIMGINYDDVTSNVSYFGEFLGHKCYAVLLNYVPDFGSITIGLKRNNVYYTLDAVGSGKYNYNYLNNKPTITTSVTSSSTDSEIPSAKCLYDQMGGLKIVKLTQSEYDGLATKDNSTLYVIVN